MLEKVLSGLLRKIGDDIDTGNCNMSEEELLEAIEGLKQLTSTEISKYKACEHLNISRAKFDNLIREGKLPKGKKKVGFTELFWNVNELDRAVEKLKKNKNNE